MKKNIKNILQTVSLFVFCFMAFFLLFQNQCFAQTRPLVKVNGVDLIEYDLQLALNEIMPAGVFHGGFSSEKRATYRPQAIENMIDKELLYQETLKRGMTFDAGSIKKARKTMIDKIGNLKKYKLALKKNGLTDEHYIRNLKKNTMVKKILKIEIDNKAKISDKEALEYYKNNVKSFLRPKAIRLRHIMISVKPNAAIEEKNKLRKKAVQLLVRIKAGEDMASLARQYSNDRYRIKGGDYGFIHMGRLDPDLEKQLMELEINKISDVIETRFGYHLARIEEIKPPTQLSYEQASKKIKMQLAETKKKSLKKALLLMLREKAEIIIY